MKPKVMGSSMLKMMGIIISAFERNSGPKQTYSSTCIGFLLLFTGTCLYPWVNRGSRTQFTHPRTHQIDAARAFRVQSHKNIFEKHPSLYFLCIRLRGPDKGTPTVLTFITQRLTKLDAHSAY